MKKTTKKSNSISQVANFIAAWDSFLLIGHEDPDGDCLGSIFSFGLLLQNLGKKISVGLYKPLNDKYSFIKNNLDLECFIIDERTSLRSNNGIIALDSSDSERLGPAKNLLKDQKVLNIDHHIDNKHFGDINYVSPDSAATGQIIYEIANYLNWSYDKNIAYYMSVAVLSDTGFLRYSNTDRSVIQMIDQMMAEGVNIYQINRDLYGKEKPKKLKLIGRALNNLTILENEKIAYLYLEKKDYDELGANFEDKEGIVNYARDIDNIEVGILFNEEDNRIKVSMRSNEYYPVNELAAEFGGGGHPKAAGCGINLKLEKAIKEVIDKAIEINQEIRG
ncbi:MAG: DHH family phosphoesterase [Bacillota bacterium]